MTFCVASIIWIIMQVIQRQKEKKADLKFYQTLWKLEIKTKSENKMFPNKYIYTWDNINPEKNNE